MSHTESWCDSDKKRYRLGERKEFVSSSKKLLKNSLVYNNTMDISRIKIYEIENSKISRYQFQMISRMKNILFFFFRKLFSKTIWKVLMISKKIYDDHQVFGWFQSRMNFAKFFKLTDHVDLRVRPDKKSIFTIFENWMLKILTIIIYQRKKNWSLIWIWMKYIIESKNHGFHYVRKRYFRSSNMSVRIMENDSREYIKRSFIVNCLEKYWITSYFRTKADMQTSTIILSMSGRIKSLSQNMCITVIMIFSI